MKLRNHFALLVFLFCVFSSPPGFAVLIGEIDTFEDATTENWIVNLLGMGAHPAPPQNIATGGPAGADDNYLLLTSVGGSGAGSRMSVINVSQWMGDFLGAGITSIEMDVNNLGSTELALRLLFADPTVGPPSNVALSSDAVIVPVGGGWIHVVFPIEPDDLTAALGNVVDALTGATEMRIFHNPDPTFPPSGPPAIVALLGVDNIQAVSRTISEPPMLGLLLFGLGMLLGRRPRSHRVRASLTVSSGRSSNRGSTVVAS